MSRTRERGVLKLLERAARVAFTFVVLNYSAVVGMVAAVLRRKVWR